MSRGILLVGKEVAGEEVESSGHGFEILIDSCLPFGESGLQVSQTLLSRVWRDHVGAAGVIRRKRHGRGVFWRSGQKLVGRGGGCAESERSYFGQCGERQSLLWGSYPAVRATTRSEAEAEWQNRAKLQYFTTLPGIPVESR